MGGVIDASEFDEQFFQRTPSGDNTDDLPASSPDALDNVALIFARHGNTSEALFIICAAESGGHDSASGDDGKSAALEQFRRFADAKEASAVEYCDAIT